MKRWCVKCSQRIKGRRGRILCDDCQIQIYNESKKMSEEFKEPDEITGDEESEEQLPEEPNPEDEPGE